MGSNPIEIADIFSYRLDVIWGIGGSRPLVSGKSGHRLQRLDRIERRNPLVAAFRFRLAQTKMNIVVEHIAANGKSDGRNVDAREEPLAYYILISVDARLWDIFQRRGEIPKSSADPNSQSELTST
jgi:hypothetical protein